MVSFEALWQSGPSQLCLSPSVWIFHSKANKDWLVGWLEAEECILEIQQVNQLV